MNHGLVISTIGPTSHPHALTRFAQTAEAAGWDGIFVPDVIQVVGEERAETSEAWVALAAIASVTERIRLGPIVTPVARYRPWHLARLATTLDQLSNGRLILGVGAGDEMDAAFLSFGEATGARTRASLLDEGLDIIDRLWRGEDVSVSGEHSSFDAQAFQPVPVQQPRIPIWVGWQWPNRKPIARVARWDGAVPFAVTKGELANVAPGDLADAVREIVSRRDPGAGPIDVVGYTTLLGESVNHRELDALAEAGATWLIEYVHGIADLESLEASIAAGPPVPAALSAAR